MPSSLYIKKTASILSFLSIVFVGGFAHYAHAETVLEELTIRETSGGFQNGTFLSVNGTVNIRWQAVTTGVYDTVCLNMGASGGWSGTYKLERAITNGWPTYTSAVSATSSNTMTLSGAGYGMSCFEWTDEISVTAGDTTRLTLVEVTGTQVEFGVGNVNPYPSLNGKKFVYSGSTNGATWTGYAPAIYIGKGVPADILENNRLGISGIASPSEDFQTFSTTTIPVEFVYYLDEEEAYTKYILTLYNFVTGAYSNSTGTLSSVATLQHLIQTTSLTVPNAGTYTLTIGILKPNSPHNLTVGATYDVTFNAVSQSVPVPPPIAINTTYASTSCAINFLGSFSLSECVGYLLVPSSNIYNLYGGIPTLLGTKFPFSYITSVQNTWKDLSIVNGTAPVLNYNLHDLGLGSTTPLGNLMPNFELFSEDTVTTYLNPTILDLFKSLVATVLVLLTFLNIYAHSMRLLRHT